MDPVAMSGDIGSFGAKEQDFDAARVTFECLDEWRGCVSDST
jgi:hypothetical protein